jgi:hypothetical protein
VDLRRAAKGASKREILVVKFTAHCVRYLDARRDVGATMQSEPRGHNCRSRFE